MSDPAKLTPRLVIALGAVIAILDPLYAQASDEVILPRITDNSRCAEEMETDIVVCGRKPSEEPYRLPPTLREDPYRREEASSSARMRDARELDRFSGLADGPNAMFKRSWQVACQWRAERQQIAGHEPDCTRNLRQSGD